MTVEATLPTQDDEEEPEKFGPGSDIYKSHPEQVIGTINNTHVLALNIYPVFEPQYLLLTLDSYRDQDEDLDLQDVEAAWAFLNSSPSPHYVMYNCTKDAGCSRHHKHIQILRRPGVADSNNNSFCFFPDAAEDANIKIPYKYFIHSFKTISEKGERKIDGRAVFDIYVGLLAKCKEILGIPENESKSVCPHNVVLVKEWMVVIPRRCGNFQGLSANSVGMMGMPTIITDQQFQQWVNVGPAKVLGELGVLNDEFWKSAPVETRN
jgi:ATP adenylyltransferase/5',5'''-P-1,P-4-tetraphosphate phosphorylase II